MSIGVQLLFVTLVLLALGLTLVQRSQNRVRQLREDGMYPPQGEEADADVDRLLQHGHKIEAIKVYRTVHRVGLKDAKDAVEERQKNLGVT
jgi:ribosomal protein L7/L12